MLKSPKTTLADRLIEGTSLMPYEKNLPVCGQVSRLLLPNRLSFLSGGTVQPGNTYCYILEQVSSEKTRKG